MSFNVMSGYLHTKVNSWMDGAYIVTALKTKDQIQFCVDSIASVAPTINNVIYSKDFRTDNLDILSRQLSEAEVHVRLTPNNDGNATVYIERIEDSHDIWFSQEDAVLARYVTKKLAYLHVPVEATISREWCVFSSNTNSIEDGEMAKRIEIKLVEHPKFRRFLEAYVRGIQFKDESSTWTPEKKAQLELLLDDIEISDQAAQFIADQDNNIDKIELYISSTDSTKVMICVKDHDDKKARALLNKCGKATDVLLAGGLLIGAIYGPVQFRSVCRNILKLGLLGPITRGATVVSELFQ